MTSRLDPDQPEDYQSLIEEKYGPRFARLEDGKVVSCKLDDWTGWYSEREHRIIGRYETETHLVSTIFLGLNHGHHWDVRPVWFETMVFDKSTQGQEIEIAGKVWETKVGDVIYEERYSTPEEAMLGHEAAIAWLKEELAKS